jgi:alkylhydroperoxidase/carboxymuconolactone decarboxylase family protein YurZ
MARHSKLVEREARERAEWKGERPRAFFDTVSSNPVIGDGLCGLCDALLAGMPARTRELVALRVSAELDSAYAWHGHVRIACGVVLSWEEIAAVAAGPAAFAGYDAIVLRAVDELLHSGSLRDATRSALGTDELVVKIATGTYWTVAAVIAGVEPEPGIAPVAGLESPDRARLTYAAIASGFVRADPPSVV